MTPLDPKLSHIEERDGLFYMYFWRLNKGYMDWPPNTWTYNAINPDGRLTFVLWGDVRSWSYYCWSTPDQAVALEYTLRYK